jgi:hypothetical protein
MSAEQSEYYFKTGEDAIIPIEVDNSYGKQISGMLQYTITQQIHQGNFQFSNSNSNAKSFNVNDGNQKVSLNFGTSDTPATFSVTLNFNYNDGGSQTVPLGPITIYFVSDESQKNNQPNPMQGSSQKATTQQSDPFYQQQQQMQQRLDQLFGNQQLLPQDPQQRLQNNQLSQDSSALKKQMQQQLQQQEQTQREFEKQLSANANFTNPHQQLLQNGYNVTNSVLNPISNDTGSFEIHYKNSDGKWATLEGNMNNGTINDIKEQTQEHQEKLLEKLQQDERFQQFHKQLAQERFSQSDTEFQSNGNKTSITLQYENQKQDNATIIAVFTNDQIQSVTLHENSDLSDLVLLVMSIVSVAAGAFIAYMVVKRLRKKTVIDKEVPQAPMSKQFDYVAESRKLISKAQQCYDEEKYKEAFGTAGQAIRLYLSHEMGVKKEVTNERLIQLLPDNYPIEDIKACLGISDLVEFAKSEHEENDFKKIVSLFTKLSAKANAE